MARNKVQTQEPESLDGKTVIIKRPIQQDGLLDGGGWAEVEVNAELALYQLSLPKADRNAHWRNVQLVEGVKDVKTPIALPEKEEED